MKQLTVGILTDKTKPTNKHLYLYDTLHARCSDVEQGYIILKTLEKQIPVINSSDGLLAGRNKWICYQKLKKHQLAAYKPNK